MNSLIDDKKYEEHIAGDCDSECPYCKMENEINDEYEEVDEKRGKSAKVSRFEKQMKNIW